jgi:hypothetical protein
MITLGFYFLSSFSCDAQQVAHAKKMVQGISKNEEPCLWVFHFPKCHESSNTLHRTLKCTREI